jgi:hypothetical protein
MSLFDDLLSLGFILSLFLALLLEVLVLGITTKLGA